MDTGIIDAGIWKSATGKGRKTPKGRQASDMAISEVRALLGDRPRERHLLIEFLHLIQDHYRYLSIAHMAACERMDCTQRAHPPIGHELRFDGHMRRVGLYDLDIN